MLLFWTILLAMFHICLCYNILTVLCSLVVTCWERADLLALLCIVFCHYPICGLVRLVPLDTFKPSSILLTVLRRCIFCGSFLLFIFHVFLCYAILSVPCSLVITCWEMGDLLALLCVVFSCVLLHSHILSWVKCCTSFSHFLIFIFV